MAKSAQPKKHRSPAYPFVSLKLAVERVRELYEQERTHEARIGTVAGHWGFKPKSSGGHQTIGALKQYGLLEDAGGNLDERKVKLTELARRITLHAEGSDERAELLRRAAVNPPLYSDMFSKWDVEFPSDENIRSYLLFERNFNEVAIASVINNYKDTLQYSGVTKDDTMSDKAGDTSSQDESRGHGMEPSAASTAGTEGAGIGLMSLSVPYAKGNITVQVKVSGEALKPYHLARVRKYLELAEEDWESESDGPSEES